ncbi:uncharacterized protein LOC110107578 [Dendrobium catenatum]|uniref:UDP-N-acetylglucosamine--N-acetylmuramyl-(Pentapeptide) pyrophosphoryl-undecaprenol N-acetylglucosamine transferase n=1 Tax=Dendrobium catenatum TaxID=906689 RepID=A0A2I0WQI9_9ASPA|nr:uncharacterized protein LOC110107578 [Dendrobium catenatum]PKU77929.1 UDP-N-acetylglucosamine--N-acetylmuramyl-(pentapeptide) pyrophosphoryl-undecaprenol N-acetylglucosamine transferase [Dendrobium catenatum]
MATVQALSFSFSTSQQINYSVLQPNQSPRRRSYTPSSHRSCRNFLLSCCFAISQSDQDASAISSPSFNTVASSIRFVFTGGGSGGHIYPAIAIADELRSLCPDAKFLFLGTSAGLESNIVPSAGYDFTAIPASRLSRPFPSPENLLFPFHVIHAIAAAWQILRRFRTDVVIGTGGYVAAPVYLAAVLSGTKIAIQEQNAFPGIANKIASPFASKVFLAFNECLKHFPNEKCSVFGNPVRLSLRSYVSKAVARTHFFPNAVKLMEEKAQVVLVLGGSQGANPINVAVLNMYYDMLLKHRNRFIIWQTGKDGFNEMESLVKNHRRLLLTPFLQAMDLAYAAADLVVSRAGAMTCTEILTTGKPSILIPSPYVAEDHQTKNALIMSDVAGSKILTEDELDSSSLATTIDAVLGDEDLMEEMSEKALKSALPNAAIDIAQSILYLVKVSFQK